MLEQPRMPDDLDAAIQQIQCAERALAAQQLDQIVRQLAELAESARSLVGPIEPTPQNHAIDLKPS